MQFLVNDKMIDNMMNEVFSGSDSLSRFSACGNLVRNPVCVKNTGIKCCKVPGFSGDFSQCDDEKWLHKIDLSRMPTKPEDLHVKMEENTLSVSGKSELSTDGRSGMKIFSVHNWQKDISVPETCHVKTLSCKIDQNWLIFRLISKRKKKSKMRRKYPLKSLTRRSWI